MARSEWYVLIMPSVSVFIGGQTKTDINKIKQMADNHLYMKIHVVLISFSFTPFYPLLHSPRQYLPIQGTVGLCSEQKSTVLHCQHFRISFLSISFLFSLIGYASAFHSSMLCSLAFEAMVHFNAIPLRVNGWYHIGLRWFRMANPAESVISSQRHQFGVWNRAPGEPDSLGDSWQEQRAWGSAHTHLDKTGISQSASNTWSEVRKEEERQKHDRQLRKKVQRECKKRGAL